jgi:hypothetical protein
VPRSVVIFLSVVSLIAFMGFFGLPLIRQKLFTPQMESKVTLLKAEEDFEVMLKGKSVSRMVLSLEILFPINGAPETKSDLTVLDGDSKPVQVEWQNLEKQDDFDKGTTTWKFPECFFPINFRVGSLRDKYKELGKIIIPPEAIKR